MSGTKKSKTRLATTLAVVLLLLFGPVAVWGEEDVTIEGEIEEAEYDEESGAVTTVSIWDSEWGSVLVSNQGKGRELLNHVGAVAKVTGTIRELDDGSGFPYVIQVSSYTIEEPAEPDDYPDDEPDREPDKEN
jgi:hypothetical protein